MQIPFSSYWQLLRDYLRSSSSRLPGILLVITMLAAIGLELTNPQILRLFIDDALAGAEMRRLMLRGGLFLAVALAHQTVKATANYLGEDVAWRATNLMRLDVAAHCVNLDMRFHNDRSPGELIERVDGDIEQIAKFFSQLVIQVIGNMLLLAGVLAVLLLEDWRVGALFAVFAATTLATLNALRSIAVTHDRALRQAEADLFGYLEERLSGTEELRASGAVRFALAGLLTIHRRIGQLWAAARGREILVHVVAGLALVLGHAIALTSGFYLYRAGALSIGTVFLILHYTDLIARPIRHLMRQVEDLQNIGACVQRVRALLQQRSAIVEAPTARLPGATPAPAPRPASRPQQEDPATDGLSLAFEQVTFGYSADNPVLHDLSLELAPGRILGIVGRTGSGKSTIARLVTRLYDPQRGVIRVGGVDVKQLRIDELRSRVAMVTQEVQLFRGTVRENLTLFDDTVADGAVHRALVDLELSDWVATLPAGLDAEVGHHGTSLSAGESQLLALARVALRQPGLVILDEASSRLDPVTEARLERALDRLTRGRTVVVIAHRLRTIHRADDVLVLDDGLVQEYGRRAELAADRASRLSALLRTGSAGMQQ